MGRIKCYISEHLSIVAGPILTLKNVVYQKLQAASFSAAPFPGNRLIYTDLSIISKVNVLSDCLGDGRAVIDICYP